MTNSNGDLRFRAFLTGYGSNGEIVYRDNISIDDYYDGDHVWDTTASVLDLGMVKLHGKLFGPDQNLIQEFESHFSAETGDYVGGKAVHEDGTITKNGIFHDEK